MRHIGAQRDRRIALVRHARSAHLHKGWINAHGFAAWREAYEAAGIAPDQPIPTGLAELVREAAVVASSDAPRAVATAEQLVSPRPVEYSSLLRELELKGPKLAGLRLPLPVWALAVGLHAFALSLRGQFPSAEEVARIREASLWLQDLAASRGLTVAVTHGSIRREIYRDLLHSGWHPEPGPRTIRHWSAWVLRHGPHPSRPVAQPSLQRTPPG